MKNLLLVLFLLLSGVIFSQKYIKLVPETLPDSAGCNGKIKSIVYGGAAPYQMISWWSGVQDITSGLLLENVCDNAWTEHSIIDAECGHLHSEIVLHNDSSLQIYLDTVLITMPSSPGSYDGTVQVFFDNLPTNYAIEFVTTTGSTPPYTGPIDSTFTFTNLGENNYFCVVKVNNDIQYLVGIDMFFSPTQFYNCELFESEILINSPTTSSSCDGGLVVNPIYGPNGAYRHFFIYHYPSGGSTILNANEYDNYVDNLCQGVYTINVQNDSTYLTKYYSVFLDTNGIIQVPWNFPDSLLPDTDTILLNALMDCNINYNIGVDTAYISSFNGIGNNQYDIEITFIQDTNTIIINSFATVDTSLNFFFDITTFCPDSSRSTSDYYSLRSMFYHGVKLQPVLHINDRDYFSSFKIYPNPFESNYAVEFDLKKEEQITFELTDISGKIISSRIYSGSNGKNRLDFEFSDISNGLYLLRIVSENGQSVSKKMIKN